MRWLLAAVRRLWRGLWRWVVPDRKVLVQDDGTGHQAFVEEGPTILLTGAETTTGHFFRGPDDPADTPAHLAILEPGDVWVDTTGGVPYQHKDRNAANDGWDPTPLIYKNPAGVVLAEARVWDGKVTLGAYDDADPPVQRALVEVDVGGGGDGSINIHTFAANDAAASLSLGGGVIVATGNLIVVGLPTADPVVAGALWNDTGTVKVSAG